MSGQKPLPLAGLKVLEFGQIVTVPFCGMLLADLGADVVKVENPEGGDGMRQWPPLLRAAKDSAEFSSNFASLNRNKRSITADLKNPEQVAQLLELCAVADVVIENFRPGVMGRLGLGYEELAAKRPQLIYCSVTGYGQEGPYAKKGAFDVTVQAMSGLMSVTGEEGGLPVKCGVPVADFAAGLYAGYSILAAVMEARRSGQGARIDCSMLGCMLAFSALQVSEYYGNGVSPKRLGSAHPRNAPYQAYAGSDKTFVIAAGNDKLWGEVCEAVGMSSLKTDVRFVTQSLRASNQRELAAVLAPQFAKRSAADWLAEFDRRGVPCSPINDFADVLSDPHVIARGWLDDLPLPNGMSTPTVGFPVSISGLDVKFETGPPSLGAHTKSVRADWLR